MGAKYGMPTVAVGMLPSVVYRIAAPEVAVLIVTFGAVAYVPAPGLKVGVAAGVDALYEFSSSIGSHARTVNKMASASKRRQTNPMCLLRARIENSLGRILLKY